jgi:Cellulose binding domain
VPPPWRGEPGRRGPGEPCQHWWLDEPEQAPPGLAARRRWLGWLDAAALRGWLDAGARHPWYVALGVGAGFMALASGVVFLLPNQASRSMSAGCAAVRCGTARVPPAVTVPGPVVAPTTTNHSRPAQRRAVPTPSPTASTGAAPATTAPALAAPVSVTINYTLVAQWIGGLLGEFTVANDGNANITGWKLTVTFPGDQIQATWGASAPYAGGDTVTMQAPPDLPAIAPGTSQSMYFVAAGSTLVPSDCTFNDVACSDYSYPGP